MQSFPELDAMRAIATAIDPLDEDARQRTLAWAQARFGGQAEKPEAPAGQAPGFQASIAPAPEPPSDPAQESAEEGPWEHFAELYDAAGPSSDPEKLLVAAFWVQEVEGHANFTSIALNNILKDLGHPVGHISERMGALTKAKPALILQLKKSGSTRQARKTFKLTRAGSERVKAMTRGG